MVRYTPAGISSETVLYKGVTTSDGNVLKTTFIDSALIGVNDFVTDTIVIILSGDCRRETRDISIFTSVSGTITVGTAFSAQIVSGVSFAIVARSSSSVEIAELQADVGDASASSLGSLYGILGDPTQSFDTNLNVSGTEALKDFVAKTGATEIGAAKSLVDAIGHTGLARTDSGLDGVLADGLINGTGTVLPVNKSLIDHLGGAGFVTGTDSLEVIAADVAEILDMTRSEALVAVTAAETNLFIDDTPTIIINGLSVKIDLTNMAAGDTYVLREYYRITNGGGYFQVSDDAENTYVGVQTPVLKVVGLETYRYGCKVTAQKIVGTDRSFQTEVIVEA